MSLNGESLFCRTLCCEELQQAETAPAQQSQEHQIGEEETSGTPLTSLFLSFFESGASRRTDIFYLNFSLHQKNCIYTYITPWPPAGNNRTGIAVTLFRESPPRGPRGETISRNRRIPGIVYLLSVLLHPHIHPCPYILYLPVLPNSIYLLFMMAGG